MRIEVAASFYIISDLCVKLALYFFVIQTKMNVKASLVIKYARTLMGVLFVAAMTVSPLEVMEFPVMVRNTQ